MAIDEKTKALIAVGASVTAGCSPCLEHHARKALEAGATPAEIQEALDTGRMIRDGLASRLDRLSRRLIDIDAANDGNAGTCNC